MGEMTPQTQSTGVPFKINTSMIFGESGTKHRENLSCCLVPNHSFNVGYQLLYQQKYQPRFLKQYMKTFLEKKLSNLRGH